MGAGSHIVASTALYGGSQNLLHYTMRRFGIDTTFVKPGDLDGWRAAIRPETKLLFGETVGNPGLDVLDIPQVAAIAHEAGVPLLVDSTLTSPYLMKPFELGRRPGLPLGHQVPLGPRHRDRRRGGGRRQLRLGALGQIRRADRSPTTASTTWCSARRSTVGAFLLRARREGLRDFGACMSPHTAWLILQGIETLPLRMERHMSNTRKVVEFLAAHPFVAHVGHPMLESHPSHALAQQAAAARAPARCSAST